jgi:YD repeat-containing protein
MRRRGHCLMAYSVLALSGAASAAETVTYTYDGLGRLTATTSTKGPATGIGYDPAGNRLTYGVTGAAPPPATPPPPTPGVDSCGPMIIISATNSYPTLRYTVVRSLLAHTVVGSLLAARNLSETASPSAFATHRKPARPKSFHLVGSPLIQATISGLSSSLIENRPAELEILNPGRLR